MITQLFTAAKKKGLMTTGYDHRTARVRKQQLINSFRTFLCCARHSEEMVPLTTMSPTCDCMTTNLPSATKLHSWQLHCLHWVVCLAAHGVVPAMAVASKIGNGCKAAHKD